MNNINKQIKRQFSASLHTHMRSLFDAQIELPEMEKRIKELSGDGFVLTDHGHVMFLETAYTYCKEHNLKFVGGIEGYVLEDDDILKTKRHIIIFPKNYQGHIAMCKAITDSEHHRIGGKPCFTKEILKKNFGKGTKGYDNVFITSACVGGILSTELLKNEILKNDISEEEKNLSDFENDNNLTKEIIEGYYQTKRNISDLEQQKDDAQREIESYEHQIAQKNAEIKALKAEKKDTEEKKEEKKKLQKNKKELKDKIKIFNFDIRQLKSDIKGLNKDIEKRDKYISKIQQLQLGMVEEKDLYNVTKEMAKEYADILGAKNFLIEVQYHGIPKEKMVYPKLAMIAKELNLTLVASNDVHILKKTKEDILKRELLINKNPNFKDKEYLHHQPSDEELYLKDNYELFDSLKQILPEEVAIEAINNIDVIFSQCNVEIKREKHYPSFKLPKNFVGTKEDFFRNEIKKGIKSCYTDRGLEFDKKHQEQLKKEENVIVSMGYVDYHLVTQEYLKYGSLLGYLPEEEIKDAPLDLEELEEYIKTKGYDKKALKPTIGPGRGSCVGSIVCQTLGITNKALDPIKFNLFFERFLNVERISMPDIDSDFAFRIRERVIDHVKFLYGENSVCNIATFAVAGAKGAIKDCARMYYKKMGNNSKDYIKLSDAISKQIPDKVTTFDELLPGYTNKTLYEFLVEENSTNKVALEILKYAYIYEGAFVSVGQHAAGVVISDNADISDYIPLRYNAGKECFTTQCSKEQVEENGLLKFDFLGLNTLDIITQTLENIENKRGISIDIFNIDLEDSKIYQNILQKGKTTGVFQLESEGMQDAFRRFKPTCFEDIIILISMYRPGPMQFLEDIIKIKNNEKEATYDTEEMKEITGMTYSCLVYQEQIMQACQKLAGYTLGQADMVRRYMSKKKTEALKKEEKAFIYGDAKRNIKGCVNNGITESAAKKIFSSMIDFAKYAFNKSHATAYALVSYYTAWLKYYYPVEYLTACLNCAEFSGETQKKITMLIREVKKNKIKINPPMCNRSENNFSCSNNEIFYGFNYIKGYKKSFDILKIRKESKSNFNSISDFIIKTKCTSISTLELLIKAGAFDDFITNRKYALEVIDNSNSLLDKYKKSFDKIKASKVRVELSKTCKSKEEFIEKQKEILGSSLATKTFKTYLDYEKEVKAKEQEQKEIISEIESLNFKTSQVEDELDRLIEEKELLGDFVSKHPMELYDAPEKYGVVGIKDLNSFDNEQKVGVMGIIQDYKFIKKETGETGIYRLEDENGFVKCLDFKLQEKKHKNLLKENAVVKVYGIKKSEEQTITEVDEEGNEITKVIETSVIHVQKVVCVGGPKNNKLLMFVNNNADFNSIPFNNYYVKEESIDDNSFELIVYVKNTNKVYVAPHRVRKQILSDFPDRTRIVFEK